MAAARTTSRKVRLKRSGLELFPLALGCMRLPETSSQPPAIDRPRAARVVHEAIENGVNLIDTAWPYHRCESEPFLGELLEGELRRQVFLSTKLPSWKIRQQHEIEAYLDKQLTRLRTDHIDLYLLHALDGCRWRALLELDVCEMLEQARQLGKINQVGFSFHGSAEAFQTIVEGYDWGCCMLQYNYLNERFQAGRAGVGLAADRGIDVLVMEPLLGGRLARAGPEPVRRAWADYRRTTDADQRLTPAGLALRWLLDQPEVSVVLSGMSSVEQLEENIRTAERSGPGSLSLDERSLVRRLRQAYRSLSLAWCTQCEYCLPCPEGVAIPTVLELGNAFKVHEEQGMARSTYQDALPATRRADRCTACGSCEASCPQEIQIIEALREAHELLS